MDYSYVRKDAKIIKKIENIVSVWVTKKIKKVKLNK